MKRKFTLSLFVFFISLSYSFAQCMMVDVPLAERANTCFAVYEGKVIDKIPFWDQEHSHIYTSNIIEVYKVFKGSLNDSRVEVVTPGGAVGTDMEIVTPSLELNVGDVGMFFAQSSGVLNSGSDIAMQNRFEPDYGPLGFIKYDLAEKSGTDAFTKYQNIEKNLYEAISAVTGKSYNTISPLVFPPQPQNKRVMAAVITGFTPASIHSGTLEILTINGSGFGATFTGTAKVSFANADNGGVAPTIDVLPTGTYLAPPPSTDVISWSDAQIQVIVPYKAGTGKISVTPNGGAAGTSSTNLTIPYGQLSTVLSNDNKEYRIKYANRNSKGGLTFTPNVNFSANANAKAAFMRAMQTWRCATFIDIEMSTSTTTEQCTRVDGLNTVAYDSAGGNSNCTMSSNLLGITNSYYGACMNGGVWYWSLSEADIKFKTTPSGGTWYYGTGPTPSGQYDFETVALHELGHVHLMAHVIDPNALMHWARNQGQRIVIPSTSDLDNGNEVMSRSTIANPCYSIYTGSGGTISVALMLTPSTCAVGTNDLTMMHAPVNVYPNPASSIITFDMGSIDVSKNHINVVVCDVTGKELYNAGSVQSNSIKLDVHAFSAGMYFYTVIVNGATVNSGKIAIAKE